MNSKIPSLPILSILILLFSLSLKSYGQIGPNLGQTDSWMKSAVAAMERNDYESANGIFRNLIDSGLPLPEEIPVNFAIEKDTDTKYALPVMAKKRSSRIVTIAKPKAW